MCGWTFFNPLVQRVTCRSLVRRGLMSTSYRAEFCRHCKRWIHLSNTYSWVMQQTTFILFYFFMWPWKSQQTTLNNEHRLKKTKFKMTHVFVVLFLHIFRYLIRVTTGQCIPLSANTGTCPVNWAFFQITTNKRTLKI